MSRRWQGEMRAAAGSPGKPCRCSHARESGEKVAEEWYLLGAYEGKVGF